MFGLLLFFSANFCLNTKGFVNRNKILKERKTSIHLKKTQKLFADQQSLKTENNNLQSELRKLKQSISVEATFNQTEKEAYVLFTFRLSVSCRLIFDNNACEYKNSSRFLPPAFIQCTVISFSSSLEEIHYTWPNSVTFCLNIAFYVHCTSGSIKLNGNQCRSSRHVKSR